MGEGVQVDPQGLDEQAGRYAGIASDVDHVLGGLRSDLARLAGCWGQDETGQGFGKDYVPRAGQQLEGLAALSDMITQIGNGVATTAQGYQRADDAAGGRV